MGILHKKVEYCSVCKKELEFKYKPDKSWEIGGKLCSDCHTVKMKEYMEKQQELKEQERIKESYCSLCNIFIESDKKNPKWQWNMESNIVLCLACYDKKQKEYEKRINSCVSCNTKLGFVRYNPKPKWEVEGQLCRQCWDKRNGTIK